MENKQIPIVEATKDGFSRYSDFSGVSTRAQYWYFILSTSLISIVVGFLAGDFVANIFTVMTIIPTIAVAVRRMHDVGKSGWFVLFPIYNLILLVTPSKSMGA